MFDHLRYFSIVERLQRSFFLIFKWNIYIYIYKIFLINFIYKIFYIKCYIYVYKKSNWKICWISCLKYHLIGLVLNIHQSIFSFIGIIEKILGARNFLLKWYKTLLVTVRFYFVRNVDVPTLQLCSYFIYAW